MNLADTIKGLSVADMLTLKLTMYLVLATVILIIGTIQSYFYCKYLRGNATLVLLYVELAIELLIAAALVADILTPFPG